MKKLKIITITLLIITTIFTANSKTTIISKAYPYTMTSKSFTLEVLEYNSSLIDYNGVKYLNLSMAYGSNPMGIIYDSNKNVVYIALYPDGSNPDFIYGIAEVDVTNKNLKIYRFPWQVDNNYYGPRLWTITVDRDNNLWIAIYGYLDIKSYTTYQPYLAKLDIETANLTIYYIPQELSCGNDIKYHNGYVWYMTKQGLSKINLDGVIEEFYPRYFSEGFMKFDTDCIWISAWTEGFVTRFNLTSKSFDINITGLDRPLGVEVDENFVYVAENSLLEDLMKVKYGTIAIIDKNNFTIKERKQTAKITNEGPYYVFKDSYGNLWWTDKSQHFGVFTNISNNLIVYDAISPYCYFMTEAPNTIWLSVKGSAYIGLVSPHIPGDINKDGYVNIKDAVILGVAFSSQAGDINYNPDADLNSDGFINIKDAVILGRYFGSYW